MSTPEALGRRDRKKGETREALRAAALRLAQEEGYENLTVETITEAADVSTRTFFNYFGSKDDALLAPEPEHAAELAEALAARPADEAPLRALHAALVGLADAFAAGEPEWQARLEVVRATPALWPRLVARFAGFERRLAEAVAARTGTDADADLYPGVVAAAVVGALRVAVEHWRSDPDAVPLHSLIEAAFDTLAMGLAPPSAAPAVVQATTAVPPTKLGRKARPRRPAPGRLASTARARRE